MKKSTKTVLMIGICSFAIGLAICLMASVLGAGESLIRLVNNGQLKGFSIPYFKLGNVDMNWSDWDNFEGTLLSGSERGQDIVIGKANDIQVLEIQCGAAKIALKESEDSEIHLVNNSNAKVKYRCKDDKFIIKCKGKSNDAGEIELYLPKDSDYEAINIELGAGVIDNDIALNTQKLEVEVGAGEITLEHLMAEKAEFEVGAGELSLEQAAIGKMTAQIAMGEFVYSGNIDEKAEVTVAMGNAEMMLEDEQDNYTSALSIGAGNILLGERSITAGSYDGEIGEGDKKLELECAMGNITVQFAEIGK